MHPALCDSETCQANCERFRAVAAKERVLSIRYIVENNRREAESLLLCGFYFGKAQVTVPQRSLPKIRISRCSEQSRRADDCFSGGFSTAQRHDAVAAKERVLSIRYIVENDHREAELQSLCIFCFCKVQAMRRYLRKRTILKIRTSPRSEQFRRGSFIAFRRGCFSKAQAASLFLQKGSS